MEYRSPAGKGTARAGAGRRPPPPPHRPRALGAAPAPRPHPPPRRAKRARGAGPPRRRLAVHERPRTAPLRRSRVRRRRQAAQRRARVGLASAQLGWMLLIVGMLPVTLDLAGIGHAPAPVVGDQSLEGHLAIAVGQLNYYNLAIPWGLALLLLTLRPIDTGAIRVVGKFFFGFLLGVALLVLGEFVKDHNPIGRTGFAALLLLSLLLAASLWPLLVCDCCRRADARRMPPRRMLHRLWLVFRLLFFGGAAACVAFFLQPLTEERGGRIAPTWKADDGQTAFLSLIASMLLAALALTPANRGRVLRRLGELLSTHGTKEQAVVAALLGKKGAAATLATATDRFRAVRLADLTREELADSTPDPAMHQKTVAAKLGEVDAFVSHSWSDDGNAKFDQLHEWAGGQSRFVWLDKARDERASPQSRRRRRRRCRRRRRRRRASPRSLRREPNSPCVRVRVQACIDQLLDIEGSLACLPVFLSGCQQLLILAGPTYTTRLWVRRPRRKPAYTPCDDAAARLPPPLAVFPRCPRAVVARSA